MGLISQPLHHTQQLPNRHSLYTAQTPVRRICTTDQTGAGSSLHIIFLTASYNVWLGGRVVTVLDLQSTGRGFESRPPRCRVQPGQVV